jgi:UDPglucose 6-dehydrogenase
MNFDLPKVGIVGLGFVGNAIRENSQDVCNLVLVDQDASKGYTGTYKELMQCEGIFVCVPSPQGDNGRCDTSILESVLLKLKDYKGVIISKCTVPPKVYERLNEEYPNLIHAPEFLTADHAVRDYSKGTFAFIGGKVKAYQNEAERIIKYTQHGLKQVYHCTIGEAALAKYTINSFLATKVSFMNELFVLAKELDLDYNKVAQMVTADHRIGSSHMKVPGPDGHYGFGGMCFPKDTSALIKFAEEVNVQMNVLDAAVKKNLLLRLTDSK